MQIKLIYYEDIKVCKTNTDNSSNTYSPTNSNPQNNREHRISSLKELLKYQLHEREKAKQKLKNIYGEVDPDARNSAFKIRQQYEDLRREFSKINDQDNKR